MTNELPALENACARRLTTILRIGLILTLFLAPLWIFPRGFSPTAAKLSLALLGMGGVFCLTLVRLWVSRSRDIQLPWILLGTLPFIVAAGLSVLGAKNLYFAIGSTLLIAVFILFGWSLSTSIMTAEWRQRILAALLASATLSALLAFAQFVGLLGDPTLEPIERAASTFVNRNFLGAFLGVTALPSLSLLFRRKYRLAQWLAIPSILLCLLVMTINEQTGILLAFLAGLLFLAVGIVVFRAGSALVQYRRGLLVAVLVVIIGVGGGLALWMSNPSKPIESTSNSIVTNLWRSNSGGTRFVLWGTALEMLQDQPLTGVGLGNYKNRYLEFRTVYHRQPDALVQGLRTGTAAQAHNDFLQLIAELGMPGIIALLTLATALVTFFWKRLQRLDRAEDKLQLLFLLSGAVVASAHAVVSFPFHMPISALVVVSLLGLAASRSLGTRDWLHFQLPVGGMRGLLIATGVLAISTSLVLGREYFAHAAYVRGRIDAEAGHHEEAVEGFERSISWALNHVNAHYYLAASALNLSSDAARSGDTSLAQSYDRMAYGHAKQAQAGYPTEKNLLLLSGVASNLGHSEEARSHIKGLIDSVPFHAVEKDALYILASDHVRQGELSQAKTILDALLETYPDHGQAYVLRATLMSRAGQPEEARQLLLHAQSVLSTKIEELSRQTGAHAQMSREMRLLEMNRALQELDAVRGALDRL